MEEISHFLDYFWENGKPVGRQKVSSAASLSFRILTDPYRKRFSLERYFLGRFDSMIYDSNLFDFRDLKKGENSAWQRDCIEETASLSRSIIRNIEERIILIEEAHFENDICRECKLFSPHGIWIATQNILYRSLDDPFDGVMLVDTLSHPILTKIYLKDSSSGEFTTLLEEKWINNS